MGAQNPEEIRGEVSESQIEKWNRRYREGHDDLPIPLPFVVDALSEAAPGTALDIACGTGRHAIWLAERGWRVTAIDGSEVAIGQLRERAPQVEAAVADIEAPGFIVEGSFDVVIDTFFLHRPLFAQIRRVVKPGGLAVMAFHLTGTFAIEQTELEQFFADWTAVHKVIHSQPPTIELVVQKPRLHA